MTSKKMYPCDYEGHNCPFADTYMGYEDEMCQVCCGLGVYEEEYIYED